MTYAHTDLIIMTYTLAGWLGDIGLPQYRDIFIDGLVDGNMLNELSYVSLYPNMVLIYCTINRMTSRCCKLTFRSIK